MSSKTRSEANRRKAQNSLDPERPKAKPAPLKMPPPMACPPLNYNPLAPSYFLPVLAPKKVKPALLEMSPRASDHRRPDPVAG